MLTLIATLARIFILLLVLILVLIVRNTMDLRLGVEQMSAANMAGVTLTLLATLIFFAAIGAGLLVLALVLLRRSWTAVTVTVASVVVSLAAAIVVLLVMLLSVNALAIVARDYFERKS